MDDELRDALDEIRDQLASVHPSLETSGLAITGRLLRLGRRLDAARATRLREHGMTPGEFDVLATVRRRQGRGGVNPTELQASVMISSGGMTKRLDRLEAAGLIQRSADPEDRRGVLIKLTRLGRSRVDGALEELLALELADVQQALPSAPDRERLVELLRPLLRALDAQG